MTNFPCLRSKYTIDLFQGNVKYIKWNLYVVFMTSWSILMLVSVVCGFLLQAHLVAVECFLENFNFLILCGLFKSEFKLADYNSGDNLNWNISRIQLSMRQSNYKHNSAHYQLPNSISEKRTQNCGSEKILTGILVIWNWKFKTRVSW